MILFAKLVARFRALFRRTQLNTDLADELREHLELQTAANIRAGMSSHEAALAARRQFGHIDGIAEKCRDQRGFVWLEQTRQDLRYAVRQLAKSPGFTAVVVLTLALGIGATTAIYSVIDGVVLNPIPGNAPDRLVQIGQWLQYRNRPNPEQAIGVSPPILEAIENNRDFFDDLLWFDNAQLEFEGDDFVKTINGAAVPVNFFTFLGAQPLLGRMFAQSEAIAFADRVPVQDGTIVLSHAWWQSHFAADPKVLGTTVELSGRRFTIVGVMPAHFQYPSPSDQFWLAAEPKRSQARRLGTQDIQLIARLKPGVTPEQTQAMLDAVAQRLLRDYPAGDRWFGDYWRGRSHNGGLRLWIRPLLAEFQDGHGSAELRRTLFGFFAAIGFVLLIVCANIANLTLARTERRGHELAVRAALGAGRVRLMRQLLTENLLLAFLGGVAGLVVTAWGIDLLTSFNTLPRLKPIELDGRVLGAALAASLFTGLAFGLVPAWQAGRPRLNETLAQGGLGTTGSTRRSRYRSALVVIELALAVVLLTGAGLMIQRVVRLLRVDPGFDPENLISVRLDFSGRAVNLEAKNALLEQLHERFSALPGVSAVGIFKDHDWEEKIALEGRAEPILLFNANCGVEESDFFRAARVPLLRGRYFERRDIGENVGTVIVNEALAVLCWPGENAIGKRFRRLDRRDSPTYEVIGIVGNARTHSFEEEFRPTFYRPYHEADLAGSARALVVRTQTDPAAVIPALRRELKAANPDMRMPWISVAQQTLFDSTRAQRMYRNYLVAFAGVGLLLAALGIYGVLAYSVARRTREIGIRMAVGAERRHVIGMIIGEGARLIVLGIIAGLLIAFWLTQFLANRLFEVSPTDPGVFTAVIALLSIVALLACWLPARRAAKVDPMIALRTE